MSARDPFLLLGEREGRNRRLPAVSVGAPLVAVAALGLVSMALACWLIGGRAALPVLSGFAAGAAIAAGAVLLLRPRRAAGTSLIDWGMVRATLEDGVSATAITTRAGGLVCANPRYEELFDGLPLPRALGFGGDGPRRLTEAARVAWRDGAAELRSLSLHGRDVLAQLRRAGQNEEYLVWRFRPSQRRTPLEAAVAMARGAQGRQLGRAGVMVVIADPDGTLHGGNGAFARRALGREDGDPAGRTLADLLAIDGDGIVRLRREDGRSEDGHGEDGRGEDGRGEDGRGGGPGLRVIPIALTGEHGDDGVATAFLLIDENPEIPSAAARGAATGHLHALLAMLPLGLALAERDGRLLFMNKAFQRAAGVVPDEAVVYPSDLVCDEDKATVIEAVRRFAQGRALPGDLAVRLRRKAGEPVALTIANAKGLGEASVLLSMKDDSEESTLKRQVAQATRMQAVGQLAGGVAHDFNNILTAIIGHCDLMAMRHTPGDIDYDDIQQIKQNSNRAAALTRQLLAFSRQQTLRPQILRLPEIVSEVTQLLRRLLGETIRLEVKHGRDLGLVRADPGQLEQVIVNLAVNARDAMPEGGTLTLLTCSVSAADVRRMRSDIMPIGDYTALRISDTGCGIPPDHLGKIFEPFFTTKEVGKGTGLGLSTVYGIVKQTDGFIFADSEVGRGTSFVIYLPVHDADADAEAPPAQAPVPVEAAGAGELWGTGTILLVEDEATVRAVGERALARQGYRVLTAANGDEALDVLAGEAGIDLLISDVVMPGMDGPALVAKARMLYPALRILFMSGYAEEQLRQSIDMDRIAFLSKPFSVQQLGQAARDALARD